VRQFKEIEAARRGIGVSQKVLAHRAGMREQDYSRLKKPSKQGPTVRTLMRLSKALDELIAEKEQADG